MREERTDEGELGSFRTIPMQFSHGNDGQDLLDRPVPFQERRELTNGSVAIISVT